MTERPKMPMEKRAKQFMPFSALGGLDEILRRKEWEVETRQKLKDKVWRVEQPSGTMGGDFSETTPRA